MIYLNEENTLAAHGNWSGSVDDPFFKEWIAPQDGSSGKPVADYVAPDPDSVILFDDFEARFMMAEWDAATDFVYQSDVATGNPKRRALVQGLQRAIARNSVDLLDIKTDGFLSLLVNGGVITEVRKVEILTP